MTWSAYRPVTLFTSFGACFCVLDGIWLISVAWCALKVGLRTPWEREGKTACLIGKSLDGLISLLQCRFPLQFWLYDLIAQSLSFLISMLSRDNSASLYPKITRNSCMPICLAKHARTLFQDNSIFACHQLDLSIVYGGTQLDFQKWMTTFSWLFSSKKQRKIAT